MTPNSLVKLQAETQEYLPIKKNYNAEFQMLADLDIYCYTVSILWPNFV